MKTLLGCLLCLFLFAHRIEAQEEQALNLVRNYAALLEEYAKTGSIKYRKQLSAIADSSCLINDLVAQYIAKEKNYAVGNIKMDDYYNAIQRWRLGGKTVGVKIDYLMYNSLFKYPTLDANNLSGTLYIVQGTQNIVGPKRFEERVMYFVRNNKITQIISKGDDNTLGKGLDLYSRKEYEMAFRLFRKLANEDRANYMAQYWTAIMELKGEGCLSINENIRKTEAVWWLMRGAYRANDELEATWKAFRQAGNDISLEAFLDQYGDSLIENCMSEPLRLMSIAFVNDLAEMEIPSLLRYWGRSDGLLKSLVINNRPVVCGLMLDADLDTGLLGYVNERNEQVIPCDYEVAYSFRNYGLAKVRKNGKYGFIDISGKEVIPCEYSDVCSDFIGNVTFALKDETLYLLSIDGKVLRKISGYKDLSYILLDNYFIIKNPRTDRGDMFDVMGNIVLCDIDDVVMDTNSVIKVIKNGRCVYWTCLNWN